MRGAGELLGMAWRLLGILGKGGSKIGEVLLMLGLAITHISTLRY